jgi:protein O-mannosyl-transferase
MSKRRNQNRSPDSRRCDCQEDHSPPCDAASKSAANPQSPYAVPIVCVLLLLAVALVFNRTAQHQFINYDDQDYVYKNPHIVSGLTAENAAWAFTHSYSANWHPLTWLSHMADCQFYELRPCGHHLGNVALHAATAVLLFLVLLRMTGGFWPSAFAAALFAVHPLRVESVAWVAERKDILSGLFFMLTLWAYASYVERPASWGRYVAVIVFFALGLMAKPMLVTVPFVLLLLDYWPLGRITAPTARCLGRLVIEKTPLFLLALASCAVTLAAQAASGAVRTLEVIPLSWRMANAVVTYVAYISKFICPTQLAVLYPHPGSSLPLWQVAASSLAILGISWIVLIQRRKRPYLLVGWLWYLGMLVPVIGIVQVGGQAMADRYTYLTQIGLCIVLAWGLADLAVSRPSGRRLVAVASTAVVLILMGCAWRQTGYWRDSEALWKHTIECASESALAHNNLGLALADRGDTDGAFEEYCIALEISPDFTPARNNLGAALGERNQMDDAIAQFLEALKTDPNSALTHNNLGITFAKCGQLDKAIAHFRKALEAEPDSAETHDNLGMALAKCWELDEAASQLQEALRIDHGRTSARDNLATVQTMQRQLVDAINKQREQLRLHPDDVTRLNEMALLLATNPNASIRNGPEAVELAQRAAKLSQGRQPAILGTLAAAYAETGQFADAVTTAQRAINLTPAEDKASLASLREQTELYRAGSPYREFHRPHQ